jgi:hypothetical protein
VQAAAAGVATCLVGWHYYSAPPVLGAAYGSAAAIFGAATAVGYLQGLLRFRTMAFLRVGEVIVKAGTAVVLVILGEGAAALVGWVQGVGATPSVSR